MTPHTLAIGYAATIAMAVLFLSIVRHNLNNTKP
jgi:hypothetical protein